MKAGGRVALSKTVSQDRAVWRRHVKTSVMMMAERGKGGEGRIGAQKLPLKKKSISISLFLMRKQRLRKIK